MKKFKSCYVCKSSSFGPKKVKIKVCRRCRSIHYCSVKCQKSDWKRHKKECNPKIKCGLCGNSKNGSFKKTECCGNWVCDDNHKYVLMSYRRNSCARNHSRYTMCAVHHNEGHKKTDDWLKCEECKEYCAHFEDYVWYATNEYNFKVLEEIPEYERRRCSKCNSIIAGDDPHSSLPNGEYRCQNCSDF